MKSRDRKSQKKPYHRPHLLVYGDLRTLTRSIGDQAPFDNVPLMIGTRFKS